MLSVPRWRASIAPALRSSQPKTLEAWPGELTRVVEDPPYRTFDKPLKRPSPPRRSCGVGSRFRLPFPLGPSWCGRSCTSVDNYKFVTLPLTCTYVMFSTIHSTTTTHRVSSNEVGRPQRGWIAVQSSPGTDRRMGAAVVTADPGVVPVHHAHTCFSQQGIGGCSARRKNRVPGVPGSWPDPLGLCSGGEATGHQGP